MVKEIDLWPSLAEFYIYDETVYRLLAGDYYRNNLYLEAFRRVLGGKTVVEIGPGAEIVLSRLCLEAGARKVYAIELLEETYVRARQRIAELGLGERICLIHGDARRIELPEPADYCISEIVGPIGGAEGAARIIEDCRRLLRDPRHMLPARALTQMAAVALPGDAVSRGFSEIGMHYARKTFEQLGYCFDLRVCLKQVSRDDLLSTPAPFEDLDFQLPLELDTCHDIELRFVRAGRFTGFLLWLELHVDRHEVLNALEHQESWLPVYFPLSLKGMAVEPGNHFRGTVRRTLSANLLNPDYAIEGTLERRGFPSLPLSYSAPHFERRFRANSFYRTLFSREEPAMRPGAPPRTAEADRDAPSETSISRLFDEQAKKTPDRVALIEGRSSGPRPQWTYGAIQRRTNQLAQRLAKTGVKAETPVAVCLDRSPESVMALLAIFRTGGVYVPIEPSWPSEYIRAVMEESRAQVLLTEERLERELSLRAPEVIRVEEAWEREAWLHFPPVEPVSQDQLALILYTSGSTGRPRGVASTWRQLLNRFEWLWQSYPFAEGERIGQRTSVSFIPSLWGLLGGLLRGIPTVILPGDVVRDPARLVQVLAEERITRIDLTPALLRQVMDATPDLAARLPHLKLWFTAGEALPVDLYRRFREACPEAALSNDYGSTEVSGVLAFDSRWTAAETERVPVGRPIANCQAHILDDRLRPVKAGEIGELYIGGHPVSRGYLSHADWTAEKFVPDLFSATPGARLYRMGDLARQREDGLIELHGRRDHLVKIRGMRVELDGIEAALGAHPQVRECAVAARSRTAGEQEVVAWVALRSEGGCSAEELLDFLRGRLPEAMIPGRLVLTGALPRTASGKIDRTRLPATPGSAVRPSTGPETTVRRRVAELVAEVLDRPPLSEAEEETSFPRIGVTSVTMIDLARRISEWMGREVSVTELFDHFSAARLAEHLARTYGAPAARVGGPARREADDERAIAIIGYSGRFPGAPDCETFWDNIKKGVDSIREVPGDRWEIARFYDANPEAANRTVGKWGGFLEDAGHFDPLFFHCSPREARWMDPQQRLFLEECWKALEDAGYPDGMLAGRSAGVFAGVRPSDYLSARHGVEAPLDALTLLGNDSAILASRVSHFLNLKGPSLSIDTSCSSSLAAVQLACRSLRDGECELAIAGGVCVITAPDFFVQATKAGMLSATGRCRTFDRDADGFAPGEGSGVVVLKKLGEALRDGDTIHGVIRAAGMNQDGNTGGLTVPNTLSQCDLEKAVYREAGISPETLGYVEAHGTGTRLGDPIEVEALTRAFREFTERRQFCRIGSVKENIGHLAAAAGIAGLIKVLLALRHRRIPPNVHVRQPNPAIDFESSPFVLDRQVREWTAQPGAPRRAAISSFGFSGTNVHLVVEEWRQEEPPAAAAGGPWLFTLSARSPGALEEKRSDLAAWLARHGASQRAEDVSYTLNVRRSHFRHRLWWVADSLDDLARQLARPCQGSGPLTEVGARYAAGAVPDWERLYAGKGCRVVRLPGYPFERRRYWHSEAPSREALTFLRPRWKPAARRRTSPGAGAVAVIPGTETGAVETAVAAAFPSARILERDDAEAVDGAARIYFLDDSAGGLMRLLRLVRRLDPERPLDLTVATRGVFEDTNPDGAALAGFCRALINERTGWTVRCVDIAAPEDILQAADGCCAVRHGVLYEQILEPVRLPRPAASAFREGGRYLIAGGGSGIGLALARHLAETYHAQSILIGRRPLSPEREREIRAAGAQYRQADLADQQAMENVVRQALAEGGPLHGVFHSALELNDAPLAEMDERRFAAGLRAKIEGTRALHRAVRDMNLDFFVCFSSVQSFLGNAGQSNYAAACAWQDAWVRAAHGRERYPVQTINWGFWGEIGAVASESFRRLWASQGVDSIGVEEGMDAVERIVASGQHQVAVPKADGAFLRRIGARLEEPDGKNPEEAPEQDIDTWVAGRLHGALAQLGVLRQAGERHSLAGLRERLSVAPQHSRLFAAMIALLTEAGMVTAEAGEIVAKRGPVATAAPAGDARVRLVEACMHRFPELLRGEVAGTEVLFPDSSLDLVAEIYRTSPETGKIAEEVARLAGVAKGRALRILEIGAGTGATSAAVLRAVRARSAAVRYVYTDVSPAFLAHGKRMLAEADPPPEFALLDIEKHPAAQGLEPESFDIIIAANVLHATRDLRSTLSHVRELLEPSGRLFLHEQTRLEAFLTVTFGWLEGWWRFADQRQQHGPLASVEQWEQALNDSGFQAVSTMAGQPEEQVVLVAQRDARGAVSERLAGVMREVLELEAADVDPGRPFVDYGVDSILAQALVNTLNRALGCSLRAADLYSHPTPRALTRKIEGAIEGAAPRASLERSAQPIPADDGRIAIIGMSGRFPGADNVDAFWEMLAAGRSAIQEVPRERWNAAEFYDADYRRPGRTNSRWGGFLSAIDRFDAAFFNILPVEAEWMDPQQRLFLEEAWRALEDAGYPDRALNGLRVGVFVGCKEGDYSRLYPLEQQNPYYSVGSNCAILAARISYALNLRGPSLAVDTACSSSLMAVQLACERLRRHPEEIALAGGVSAMCTEHTHLLLGKSGMLSPEGRCKTFSHDADGFVPGEAVGAVVLKPLAAALRDRDRIHGVILAVESNQDGRTNGITAPNAVSQAVLQREVYAAAGIATETIGYVETHGTGTRLGDSIEMEALSETFRSGRAPALGSVKTNIGHTLAAAGIASLAKVLLCLRHRQLPATLNLARLSDAFGPESARFHFPTQVEAWEPPAGSPRRAAISSFGFSGTNVHMVVEEAPAREPGEVDRPAWLIPLSAKTREALERRIGDLLQWTRRHPFELRDVACTLVRGRSHFPIRAALVARDGAELTDLLEALHGGTAREGVFAPCEPSAEQPALRQWGSEVLEELGKGELGHGLHRERLMAMADLFTKGYSIDWDRLVPDAAGRRIPLPTYPFSGERHWVSREAAAPEPARVLRVLAQKWRPSPAVPQSGDKEGNVVVMTGPAGRSLARGLFPSGKAAVVCTPAELERAGEGGPPAGCIDLTALDRSSEWDEAIWRFLQRCVEQSRGGRLRLLKACPSLAGGGADSAALEGWRLAGLYRTLGAEYGHVDSWLLDTDATEELLRTQILTEWASTPPTPAWSRWRDGERFVPEFAPAGPGDGPLSYPQDSVVLITGGTRGVGAAMARHFASKGVRRLAILGREPLPDRARWREAPSESPMGRRIASLEALEAEGIELEVYGGSLTERGALEALRERIHARWGAVTGILHCAGVSRTDHPAFIRKSVADLRAVCEPKIEGLRRLDEVFGGEPLRFFVVFSSVAAALPSLGAGHSDYATANAWMDSYVQRRFLEGQRQYRSIQWPNWGNLGMGGATSAAYDATGLLSHSMEEGFRLFEQAMASGCAVTLPCASTGSLHLEPLPERGAPARRESAEAPAEAPAGARTREWLSELFARELKLGGHRLEPQASFVDQGIDSILMAELLRAVERALGISLPPSTLFEHTTLETLYNYLLRDFAEEMRGSRAAERGGSDAASSAKPEPARAGTPLEIAVVGLSCRLPGGPDAQAFRELLRRGESAIGRTPEERRTQLSGDWHGGFLEGIDSFDAEFFRLSPEDASTMDPQARLMLEEGARALWNGGYGERKLEGRRVGVYIGARATASRGEDYLLAANPILAAGQNYIAANLSRCFNFTGPSLVIDTACSSALVGMHMAARALQHGEIDYALVGGVSLLADDAAHRLFAARGLLRPDGVFHLFDRRDGGVVLGEGAGAVLLRRHADAWRDGDRVLGVIRGIAVNNNGRTAGPNAPSFQAQKDVLTAALRESGRTAAEIGAIEASGSGSAVNDLLELRALAAVLGRRGAPCYVNSVKPTVGHLLAAAGMASFIRALLGVQYGEHPPQRLSLEPLPHFDFDEAGFAVARELRAWTGSGVRIACVASFPDGGTNCCIVLEDPAEAAIPQREPVPGPNFRKRRLRGENESREQPLALSTAVPVTTNGTGSDFWGLTE